MSEVLTLREVASLLKVHPNTVYRLARSGKLPAFKAGTDWRFERSAVETWMRARGHRGEASRDSEVLYIIYWMLSQGFSLALSASELAILLDWTPREVKRALDALNRSGFLTAAGGSAALTPDGMAEARRRFGTRARPPAGHESVRIFAERFVGS